MAETEFELISRIKQGDRRAMEAIFQTHVEAAVRLAYMITHDWPTAEDAVQEAFIQAFRSIRTFKDGMAFKPWFSRIVINKAKRVRHKFRVEPEYVPNMDAGSSLEFSRKTKPWPTKGLIACMQPSTGSMKSIACRSSSNT